MKIEETWTYDAPADRVFAMLLDPKFQESKCAATGALSYQASITQQVVETQREMSTDGLPDGVARFVGNTLRIIEIQRWGEPDENGSRTADLQVSIGGLPIDYTGRIQLLPNGDKTTMHMLGDLRARIPLVGAKIETAAAPAISSGVQIEAGTGQKYLAG